MAATKKIEEEVMLDPEDYNTVNVGQDTMVSIRLNKIDDESSGKVDQTVNVTVNGKAYVIQRGVRVSVPLEVFVQLKQSGRFPEV